MAAWTKWRELRDAVPTRTLFTHPLPDFPLPVARPLPDPLPKVAIATPCKNASQSLDDYFALIDAIDYPKDLISLHILEGDSSDDTFARVEAQLKDRQDVYADTQLIKLDLGFELGNGSRTRGNIQRKRRSTIAKCRNTLMQAVAETDADYFLCIDVDMAVIPPDTLRQLLAYQAPILMPNCLLFEDDDIFDRNAFRYTRPVSDRLAALYTNGGIYQPPSGFFRYYPSPVTGDEVELLHSVGGTVLLIRRDVIDAGTDFPEEPYHLHLETEGFALKAAELGYGSFMLPRLIVRHGPH